MAVQDTRSWDKASRDAWQRARLSSEVAQGRMGTNAKIDAFLKGKPPPKSKPTANAFDKLSKQAGGGLSKEITKAIKGLGTKVNAEAPKTKTTKMKSKAPTWDGNSTCFADLEYDADAGGVWAEFIGPAAGTWFYPMSAADARDWFNDESVGGYFNDYIR
jgi:hypothetical protein